MNIARVIGFFLNYRRLHYLYTMTYKGYLFENGWMRSLDERLPVDAAGNPIPWVTDSFLAFLRQRLKPELKLLEFGAGHSTLYYSTMLRSICSIESNPSWYETIRRRADPHAVNLLHKTGPAYYQCVQDLPADFDLVVVDGDDRLECAAASLERLSPRGVVILDNSYRAEYEPIYSLMHDSGFKHLDFFGLAPGDRRKNCTTVFYRSGNCLDI